MFWITVYVIFMGAILVPVAHADCELMSDVIGKVSLSQEEDTSTTEGGSGSNYTRTSDRMFMVVHNVGLLPATIAKSANIINDLARFLNARTIAEMNPESCPELNDIITSSVDTICPANPVNCESYDLTYRPFNNLCNNLQHPTFGNPSIAQLRLGRAFWENAGLITARVTQQRRLNPLDHLGVRFTDSVAFRVAGSSGFKLTVLSPEETCEDVFVKNNGHSTKTKTFTGVITSAVPNGDSESSSDESCDEDSSYSFYGNQLTVTGPCSGSFNICYQASHIEVVLKRSKGGTCSLKVDGVLLQKDTRQGEMYPEDERYSVPFWIEVNNGEISVGRGSDRNDDSVILRGTSRFINLSSLLSSSRYSVAFSKLGKGNAVIQVPISDVVQCETSKEEHNLDDFPFIWNDGFLRFGIDTNLLTGNLYIVTIVDTVNDIEVVISLGSSGSVKYTEQGTQEESIPIDCNLLDNLPRFTDGNDVTYEDYGAIWVTWIRNKVYVGFGNSVGQNLVAVPLAVDIDTLEFTAGRVDISSTIRAKWIFDLVQFGVPRQTSFIGRKLPTPRDVSLMVHSNIGQASTLNPRLTMAIMNFGQFVDHDVIATPVEEAPGTKPIICCVDGQPLYQNRFCFDIQITGQTDANGSQGEFPFPEHQCMGMARSSATLECGSTQDFRNREQLNVVTSFVDGSNIYGSTEEKASQIREGTSFTGALLRTSQINERAELPTAPTPTTSTSPEEQCLNTSATEPCFEAGDFRATEQPGLTSMHALWLREHNRIVRALVDGGWPDSTEKQQNVLYQETRRIVVAEYQNIVYNGYLPAFLDMDIYNQFQLGKSQCNYDSSLNPGSINEWGLANRMGHTWIRPTLQGANIDLVDHFFNPSLIHNLNSDFLQRNLYESKCMNTDRILETVITENLFRNGPDAFDLASLNIQRGRDHGVSYCRLREALGLEVPTFFQKAEQIGLFPSETVAILKESYDCVCDIDLFTAIVTETPLMVRIPGSTSPNGETLNHIQGTFFRNAKCGDRYWHEFPSAGFTEAQLASIQGVTLASILCANTEDIITIQEDPFNAESGTNPSVTCDSIPSLDLALFPYRQSSAGKESEKKG